MTMELMAGAALRGALAAAGDRALLTDTDDRTRTGAQLLARAALLAGALHAEGIAAGDRVGLWYRNGLAAFEAFIAIELLGASRLAVDPEVPAAEARAIFAAGKVKRVVADAEHASQLDGISVLLHDLETTYSVQPWAEEVGVDRDQTLVIYPRSVAGGRLFAVTMSYGNWDAMMRINCELYRSGWYGRGFDPGSEVGLTMQQLMHGTGLVTSFPFLLMGLPQVVVPKFHAPEVLDVIRRHAVTATFGVPGMFTRLADQVQNDPRPNLTLRRTLYGGAPLPVPELRRVRKVLGDSLIQLYGRFEAGWPLSILGQDEHARILAGDDELATSCGRAIPQIELRLAPAQGVAAGRGELQTRSEMVSPEYADPAGWCALGDLARIDVEGFLHLAGRLDGMINSGSYHIYPQQVAEAVRSVAGVADARVVGEPDPVWGQAVVAYVVPADPACWDETLDRLHRELPQRIARYKVPKAFHAVAKLP